MATSSQPRPVKRTVVTRERVVAPPERYIETTDGELVSYFKSVFTSSESASISKLQEMLDGLCTHSFATLRRNLEQDFQFFSNAANASPGTDVRERDPTSYSAELDEQEKRFLGSFMELLDAGRIE
jgi:hypothetical protein